MAGLMLMTLMLAVTNSAVLAAQEKPPGQPAPQSKEQAELVDGLLDLLGDPNAQPPDTKAFDANPEVKSPAELRATPGPSAAGLPRSGDATAATAGNLPGESSTGRHPLSVVHSSMQSAAERLGRGVVGGDTQQLQGEILQQLDELIGRFDQQDPAQSPNQQTQQSSPAQSQSSSMSTDKQSSVASQAPADGSQPEGERQSDSGQGAQNGPSQAAGAADVAVDLADPQRLQQDVWGQLPEQLRKQMQSRMVESFLPAYRPQIESYFRKLLESGNQ